MFAIYHGYIWFRSELIIELPAKIEQTYNRKNKSEIKGELERENIKLKKWIEQRRKKISYV